MALTRQERAGSVATLWLERPAARNALSIELCEELAARFSELDADADVRVVVLRGAGPVFCSGADFDAVAGPRAAEFLVVFQDALERIAGCRAPVVAGLHGAALGGGLQLAAACDFRIGTARVRLGVPAARLGIVVDFENVRRLVELVGAARAKEILVGAREVDGDTALAWGLVTAACAEDRFHDEVAAYADALAQLAPLSVEGMKKAVNMTSHPDRDEAGALVRELVVGAYASSDLQEGLAALRARRTPEFRRR